MAPMVLFFDLMKTLQRMIKGKDRELEDKKVTFAAAYQMVNLEEINGDMLKIRYLDVGGVTGMTGVRSPPNTRCCVSSGHQTPPPSPTLYLHLLTSPLSLSK